MKTWSWEAVSSLTRMKMTRKPPRIFSLLSAVASWNTFQVWRVVSAIIYMPTWTLEMNRSSSQWRHLVHDPIVLLDKRIMVPLKLVFVIDAPDDSSSTPLTNVSLRRTSTLSSDSLMRPKYSVTSHSGFLLLAGQRDISSPASILFLGHPPTPLPSFANTSCTKLWWLILRKPMAMISQNFSLTSYDPLPRGGILQKNGPEESVSGGFLRNPAGSSCTQRQCVAFSADHDWIRTTTAKDTRGKSH